ncbi:MAG TPA: nuclear transport factor 2 family protein [Solirubrobacterales bacterium]|jgi:ketosteroid isomerase-like protein
MTVKTTAGLDLETLKRGFEQWDIEALLSLFAEDPEQIQVDRENPPSSPLRRRGLDVYRGMFEHCKSAGVKASVENAVTNPELAAATIACEFPGGRTVVANSIFELRDGRIAREHTVACGDS